MKKIILLFVFALSLAFVGNVSAQTPVKKAPAKTVQTPAKPAETAKTTEVKKDKKMTVKKGTKKPVPATETKTK